MSAGAVLGVGACALCAAVLGALIKRSSKEYALLLSTGAAVVILAFVLKNAGPLVEQITSLAPAGSLSSLCLTVMLKAAGLTMLGQLAAYLCRDAGENALAYGVELAAKAAVLTAALPLLTRLLEYLGEILKL